MYNYFKQEIDQAADITIPLKLISTNKLKEIQET